MYKGQYRTFSKLFNKITGTHQQQQKNFDNQSNFGGLFCISIVHITMSEHQGIYLESLSKSQVFKFEHSDKFLKPGARITFYPTTSLQFAYLHPKLYFSFCMYIYMKEGLTDLFYFKFCLIFFQKLEQAKIQVLFFLDEIVTFFFFFLFAFFLFPFLLALIFFFLSFFCICFFLVCSFWLLFWLHISFSFSFSFFQ